VKDSGGGGGLPPEPDLCRNRMNVIVGPKTGLRTGLRIAIGSD
jgi:hypothetical protein